MKKGLLIAIIVIIVVGGAVLCTKNIQQEERQGNKVNMSLQEASSLVTGQELKIVSSEKNEDGKYEIVIKNTSGKYLKQIQFKVGEGIYEIYEMLPDENYKFIADNTQDNLDLEIMNLDYNIVNYHPEEISLYGISANGKVFEAAIKNNYERNLYPVQVIYFLVDKDGNTVQKVVHYEGCLDETKIILPEETFGIIDKYDGNLKYNNEKDIVVIYSDINFKENSIVFFEQ